MKQRYQYMVQGPNPPKVELTDAGLYVRFLSDVIVARTVIQSEWPHIAVDLDDAGRVIGIECVPAPKIFSVGLIPGLAADARVGGLPAYKPEDVQIENLCAA